MDRRRFVALAAATVPLVAGCSGDEGTGGGPSTSEPTTADDTGTDQPSEASPSDAPSGSTERVAVGEVASGENLSMVVEGVERTTSLDEFQSADEGNVFVVVTLAVKNTTANEFLNFSGFLQTAIEDSEDYSYDQTFAATDNTFDGGQLAPGEVSRGDLVYEVPEDASGLVLTFDFEAFSFTRLQRVTIDLSEQAASAATLDQNLQVDVHDPGTAVTYEDVTVTLNSVRFSEQVGDFASAADGREYAIVNVTTDNGTDEELTVSTLLQMGVKDDIGNTYDLDFAAQSELDRAYNEGQPIAAGGSRRGELAFEVPQSADRLYWTFEFTLWTDGDKTFWQLR